MDTDDREILATFSAFMRRCLDYVEPGDEAAPVLVDVLREHLGQAPTSFPIARMDIHPAEFVNLDVAVQALVDDCGGGSLVGVGGGEQRHHMTLGDLLQGGWSGQIRSAAVDRARVATGPTTTREAVSFGAHLFSFPGPDGDPVVLLQRQSDPRHGRTAGLEVLAAPETAEAVLSRIRQNMSDHNVFRAQVVSFAEVSEEYEPSTGGISFHERPRIDADQVILPAGALERIHRHIVGTARHRAALQAAGQHLKRGLLLYGPPGTGKTHTVRHLIGSLEGVTCFLLSGNSLRFIAETATMAQALQPSVVVLEDVDLIAEDRGMHGPQPLLFSLLDAMDGLSGESDIAFILTTNRADLLEDALSQRPGRVDLALHVPRPDAEERLALLRLYAGSLPLRAPALGRASERPDGVTASFFKELGRRTVLVAAEAGTEVNDDLLTEVLDEMLSDAETLTRTLLGVEPPSAEAGGRAEPNPLAGNFFTPPEDCGGC
ncbi:MAG: ATP-binding protein [Propionibacteriaceae bacterium]|nr:ATP-binding protein [Propionibacteriaceae bacterium]